jgi:hypothetical protein
VAGDNTRVYRIASVGQDTALCLWDVQVTAGDTADLFAAPIVTGVNMRCAGQPWGLVPTLGCIHSAWQAASQAADNLHCGLYPFCTHSASQAADNLGSPSLIPSCSGC